MKSRWVEQLNTIYSRQKLDYQIWQFRTGFIYSTTGVISGTALQGGDPQ